MGIFEESKAQLLGARIATRIGARFGQPWLILMYILMPIPVGMTLQLGIWPTHC